jgi:WD40 repeat protein
MLGGVNAISLTPDGKHAVSASNDFTLRIWELNTGASLGVLRGHSDVVRNVCITPDGTRAVSASLDKTVRVWDLDTCRELHSPFDHPAEAFGLNLSHDGRIAVSACNDDALRVWDLNNGELIHTFAKSEASHASFAISADDRFLVTCCNDMSVWDLKTGRRVREFPVHWDVPASARGLALTEDCRFAIATWVTPAEIQIWDVTIGKRVAAVALDQDLNCFVFVPKTSILITGGIGGNVSFFKLVGF